MFYIGCHLSASKGFAAMGKTALEIGANTFQFFTRNPRGGKAKDVSEKDVADFLTLAKENRFGVLLAHAPYKKKYNRYLKRKISLIQLCLKK